MRVSTISIHMNSPNLPVSKMHTVMWDTMKLKEPCFNVNIYKHFRYINVNSKPSSVYHGNVFEIFSKDNSIETN